MLRLATETRHHVNGWLVQSFDQLLAVIRPTRQGFAVEIYRDIDILAAVAVDGVDAEERARKMAVDLVVAIQKGGEEGTDE
jgi:hypothetical protein